MSGTRRTRRPAPEGMVAIPPPHLPQTPDEIARSADLCRQMKELTKQLRENNLTRTLALVQMALRGQVPKDLEDHLSEIGRRFHALADNPPKRNLTVVQGGRD